MITPPDINMSTFLERQLTYGSKLQQSPCSSITPFVLSDKDEMHDYCSYDLTNRPYQLVDICLFFIQRPPHCVRNMVGQIYRSIPIFFRYTKLFSFNYVIALMMGSQIITSSPLQSIIALHMTFIIVGAKLQYWLLS